MGGGAEGGPQAAPRCQQQLSSGPMVPLGCGFIIPSSRVLSSLLQEQRWGQSQPQRDPLPVPTRNQHQEGTEPACHLRPGVLAASGQQHWAAQCSVYLWTRETLNNHHVVLSLLKALQGPYFPSLESRRNNHLISFQLPA